MFPTLDYSANQKYFKTATGCLLIFAFILVFAGLIAISSGGWIVSLIGIGLGLVHFMHRPEGPGTIDDSVDSVMEYARDAAARKLAVTAKEQAMRPIEVFGFSRQGVEGAGFAQSRIAEGVPRTSVIRVLITFFGHDQMRIYTLAASLTEPDTYSEKTVEFFYRDVVSLSTESGPQGTALILSTSDGSKYDCPVTNPEHLDSEVNVARELIRSKRLG